MEHYTRAEINQQIAAQNKKIDDLEIKCITDATNASSYQELITAAQGKITTFMELLSKAKDDVTATVGGGDYAFQCALTNLALELKSVPRFQPGVEIETFITNLDNIYYLQVATKLETWPRLELEFVTMVQSRLHSTYVSSILNAGKKFDTYAELKAYLVSQFSSNFTNFQILNRLMSCSIRDNESYSDFGRRMDIETTNAATLIASKYAKENATTANPTPVLDSKQTFALFGAMLACEEIRKSSPVIYQCMIKSINKFSSAGAIAAEAQSLADRQVDNDLFNGYVGHSRNGAQQAKASHVTHVATGGTSFAAGDVNASVYAGQAKGRGNGGKGKSAKSDDAKAKGGAAGSKDSANRIKSIAAMYKVDEKIVKNMYDNKLCVRFNLNPKSCQKTNCPFKHESYNPGHSTHYNAVCYDDAAGQGFAVLDF